jgi:probable F420-dependent oxidoreductase
MKAGHRSQRDEDMSVSASAKPELGPVGIWSLELRFGDPSEASEAATELDELGFGALWTPGGIDDQVLGDLDRLLSATSNTVIATGILNIWKHEPADVAAWWTKLSADGQARVLLGLGVSHSPLIGDAYQHPLQKMRAFLTELADDGVPAKSTCLAALAPKMLALSAERTAGTHPYLVTPEHSAVAREAVGPDGLVAPEQGVILETDPAKARALGRAVVAQYGQLPNYVNNWRRLGFSDDEISGVSDRLVDGLFAWGSMDKIVARVKAHHDAGADHVCLQVISGSERPDVGAVRAAWRELAAALL